MENRTICRFVRTGWGTGARKMERPAGSRSDHYRNCCTQLRNQKNNVSEKCTDQKNNKNSNTTGGTIRVNMRPGETVKLVFED
ncbi:hypothetical protein A4D02_10965 [Niastella koreensis]|uniref:Uncharacterized protein n=1 Tax=Niastella koreensis TaxID=354356 RepID=A0ABX3NT35_9BACT|nr:hypothetical protein A4D02_10965 [Niastella koreensis]